MPQYRANGATGQYPLNVGKWQVPHGDLRGEPGTASWIDSDLPIAFGEIQCGYELGFPQALDEVIQ